MAHLWGIIWENLPVRMEENRIELSACGRGACMKVLALQSRGTIDAAILSFRKRGPAHACGTGLGG